MKPRERSGKGPEWKFFAPSLLLGAAAFLIYITFYDILIPGLPGGSYKLVVGSLFAIPSLILAFGQITVSAIFLHHVARSLGAKADGKFFRAVLVASAMTFLFAFTYVIFPSFGPFYYIVFATGAAPPNVLLIEIGWTLATIAVGAALYGRLYRLDAKKALFYVLLTYLFITVAAS